MDVKEVTTTVTPNQKNTRGWLVVAAAFAVVIAVLGVALLANQPADETVPPATTPPTTEAAPGTTAPTTTVVAEASIAADDRAVLDAYLTSIASGDEEGLRAVLSPGLQRTSDEGYSPDQKDLERLVLEAQVRHARGSSVELEDCTPAGDRVQCVMIVDGPVEQALYPFQLRDNYWFTIDGDKIVAMHAKCSVCSPGASAEIAATDWVRSFDPDAYGAMGLIPDDALSIAGAKAWLGYAPLWREAETAERLDEAAAAMSVLRIYESAFNAGDAQGMSESLSDDLVRTEFLEPGLTLGAAGLVAEAQDLHAQGTTLRVSECVVEAEALRCTFTYSGVVPSALFQGDAVYTERIEVTDGSISGWESRCAICPGIDMHDAVVAWVATQDPDAALLMGSQWYPKVTDGDPLLWLEWAPKWAEAGRP